MAGTYLCLVTNFSPIIEYLTVSNFVKNFIDIDNLVPQPLSIKELSESEMTSTRPVLFITAPGSDPSEDIQRTAEEEIKTRAYYQVCL